MTYKYRILPVYRSDRPVISVGNIAVGGVGKTPFVIRLARHLISRRKKPVILIRGYMTEAGQPSDEVQMLKNELPGVLVYASADRAESMKQAEKEHIVDVFIIDDGFQHWACARDLDIVLIDMLDPFGNGGILPYGILRESPEELSRADIVVLTRCDLVPDKVLAMRAEISRQCPGVQLIETAHVPVRVEAVFPATDSPSDISLIRGPVCACSAIGSPEGFERTLKSCGSEVVHHEVFMDHHTYTPEDIERLVDLCRKKEVGIVVMTNKDAVKMREFAPLFAGLKVYALIISIEFTKGEHEFISCVDRLLSA